MRSLKQEMIAHITQRALHYIEEGEENEKDENTHLCNGFVPFRPSSSGHPVICRMFGIDY